MNLLHQLSTRINFFNLGINSVLNTNNSNNNTNNQNLPPNFQLVPFDDEDDDFLLDYLRKNLDDKAQQQPTV